MTIHNPPVPQPADASLEKGGILAAGQIISPDRVISGVNAAKRFLELLSGPSSENLAFRFLHDSDKRNNQGQNVTTSPDEMVPKAMQAQARGYGIFVVVNQGGNKKQDIQGVRAAFIDADGVSLASVQWHFPPHFLVYRNDLRWHAYWLTNDIPCDQFTAVQKRLARYYGSDPNVCDLPRIMRVPGFLHQKNPNNPCEVKLIDLTSDDYGAFERDLNAYAIDSITQGLPDLPPAKAVAPSTIAGRPITLLQFRAWLSFIDPTFAIDQNTWAGMALAIRYGELPLLNREDIDWEALLVEWCSGALWGARIGDPKFEASTYRDPDELLARVCKAQEKLK